MNDSCATPDLMSVEQALQKLLDGMRVVGEREKVALTEASGRILAEPLVSSIDVPGWDNSAMDGYAVRRADISTEGASLPVSQRIPAGSVPEPLAPGTAARIFTGAPVPAGADAVLMQEDCTAEGDSVTINRLPAEGENIRCAGEAIAVGSVVLDRGTRMRPQEIGVAASVGAAELVVYRRLKVAVLSTGDELVEPGRPLGPGQIYNSNRYQLQALCRQAGCEVVDQGVVEDTLQATVAALESAAMHADLIITTGGVSVGEEDHLRAAIEQLGQLEMWKVRMKPGKPVAFGHIGDTPIIGMPGNPVSCFVTFCIFALPFLRASMGGNVVAPVATRLPAAFDWPKPGQRREYLRVRLEGEGQTAVLKSFPNQSSGVLTSVAWSTGLAIVNEGQVIQQGELVDYLPINELLA